MRIAALALLLGAPVVACTARLGFPDSPADFGDGGPTDGGTTGGEGMGGSDTVAGDVAGGPSTLFAISYDRSWVVLRVGEPMNPMFPRVVGTAVSFSAAPLLPDNVVLDPDTGEISGSVAAGYGPAVHTITAVGAGGENVTTELEVRVAFGWRVTSNIDSPAIGNTSDETCESVAGGCTLRAAIQEANGVPGENVIWLPTDSYTLTGPIDISTNLAVAGEGPDRPTISGGTTQRMFEDVAGDIEIRFSDLQLADGFAATEAALLYALPLSGAYLSNCRVTGMRAATMAIPGFRQGSLFIEYSLFEDNEGEEPIINTDFNADVSLIGNTFFNNRKVGVSTNSGPVLDAIGSSLVVRHNLFDSNTSIDGPAIGWIEFTTAVIEGNTMVGNTSDNDALFYHTGGAASFFNNNVAGNSIGGAMLHADANGALFTLSNNAIADHSGTADICSATMGGAVTSSGGNYTGDPLDPDCGFGMNDLAGTDPGLSVTVADWGGPTRQLGPTATSPIVDGGSASQCPAVDSRGVPRPRDGDGDMISACDAGAVEVIAGFDVLP